MQRGLSLQLALFAGAALAILGGASFNIQGYTGEHALIAMLAGIMAWSAGLVHRRWPVAAALALSALAMTVVEAHLTDNVWFGVNLSGLLSLGLGGVLSTVAYLRVTSALRQRLAEQERLNRELAEQHRMFLAATEESPIDLSDAERLAANTARQVGAQFCVYYLAVQDGTHQPQLPGAGLQGRRLQALIPRSHGDPILGPLGQGRDVLLADRESLSQAARLFASSADLINVLIEPMLVNERLAGFVVLGNRLGGFGADDRRLAATLAMRAAIHYGTSHLVSQTKEELTRYSILNEIAKQASGLSFEAVMELVVTRARELVPYDACRVITFEPDGTAVAHDGGVATPLDGGPLAEVRADGKVVIRRLVQRSDHPLSGIDPGSDSAQVAEALAPIVGREGLIGALCLGRRGGLAFGDRDTPALRELGAIAGVAVENSRILQKVAGQAVKANIALDSLGEISEALTATTQGPATLERKTLEVAARLGGATHALLCQAVDPSTSRVIRAIGFGPEVEGSAISNGQGVVGTVMLSRAPLAVADVHDSFDLASPPDLAAAGVRGALAVPVSHQGNFWGVLAIFCAHRKEWSEDDRRVLATLGNQALVALKNAELYESSQRMVWELGTLMTGLTAVTSSIELSTVLDQVLKSAAKACQAQIAVLALDDEQGRLEVAAAFGSDRETARRLALELGGEICQDVHASGKPFMQYADRPGPSAGPLDPRAVLCVPTTLRGKPIGAIFLANYIPGKPFSEDHRRVVTELAAQASVGIDNARLFSEREDLILGSLRAMARLVDAKDPYTAGHSDRVTEYALIIAREMNFAPGDAAAWERFERGCRLHDIGKINVPDAVLAKPGRLTGEEFEQLKRHPVVGWEVLRNLRMLTDELVIVRSHHERYDGRGYPDGRRGEELPVIAWIAAGADAFDAMTSDRPYRRGMSIEVAMAEIVKGAGTQFHPEVAAAFQRAVARGRLNVIRQESLYIDAPAIGAFENPVG